MTDSFYEVRGTNDPIDGDRVRFKFYNEAKDYYDSVVDRCPDATIYELLVKDKGYGEFELIGEYQVTGPEADNNLADKSIPNSCEADNSDNYDENGNFRLPAYDDGLDSEEDMFDDHHDSEVEFILVEDSDEDEDESDEEEEELTADNIEFARSLFTEIHKRKQGECKKQ